MIKYIDPPVRDKHKPSPGIDFAGEPVKTIQSMADECKISTIMARYRRGQITADMLNRDLAKMVYGDFSEIKSMQDMFQMVDDANRMFQALPTNVKEHFGFDARAFAKAASDERNRDLFISLGLIDVKPPVSSAPQGSDGQSDPIPTT